MCSRHWAGSPRTISFIIFFVWQKYSYLTSLDFVKYTQYLCKIMNGGDAWMWSLVLICFGSGPPAWLWSRHPAPGAQCWPGQSIQLGCGSLLHRLLPAGFRLLQSHRHSLWQQVESLTVSLPSVQLVEVSCLCTNTAWMTLPGGTALDILSNAVPSDSHPYF